MISKSLLEHSPASATHPGASEAEKVLALDAMSVHDAIKAVVLDLEEAVIEGVSQLRATEEVGASTLMLVLGKELPLLGGLGMVPKIWAGVLGLA